MKVTSAVPGSMSASGSKRKSPLKENKGLFRIPFEDGRESFARAYISVGEAPCLALASHSERRRGQKHMKRRIGRRRSGFPPARYGVE